MIGPETMTRTKVLLIGQAPSRSGAGCAPFAAGRRSGRRLDAAAGFDLVSSVDAMNLLRSFPGKEGKGDAFPLDRARRAAARMIPLLDGRPMVIFAGRGVAAAFNVGREDYFRVFMFGGQRAVVVPHPSGINRWWNDDGNRRRARRFFGRLRRQWI
jgi:hypothetical protein